MIINCTIKGIAPLLHNRFPDEENEEGKSKRKSVRLPAIDEARRSLYLDSNGNPYQPANHIEGAMIKAAVQFKLDGKKTYKDLVRSGVFVTPDQIPCNATWEIDRRSAVIPSTKGRIMVSRPMFKEWVLNFDLNIVDDRAEVVVIKEILQYAGLYVGIGTFRPKFGRFEVLTYEQKVG